MTGITLLFGFFLALFAFGLFCALAVAIWEAFPYLLMIAVCWWMLQALGCL